MRKVILYKSTKEMVNAFSDYIKVVQIEDLRRSFNSPDYFRKQEVEVDYLPIKRFCFDHGTTEVFAAFDRDLEELINLQIDEAVCTLESQCQKHINRIAQLRKEINFLQSRTLWDTMVSKMKTWWNK